MIDREPYAHVGVSDVHEEERPGLTCEDCTAHIEAKRAALRENFVENFGGLTFAAVPGGASGARNAAGLTPIEHRKKFEKNLDKYKGARKAGLKPKGTTQAAVDKAEQRAESVERAHKKLSRIADDVAPSIRNIKAEG